MNPVSEARVVDAGAHCGLAPGHRVLDLACGKGEQLCQYARTFGVTGVGIDVHEPLLAIARDRAVELEVDDRVEFLLGDAATRASELSEAFDLVSCLGATWIGGGLLGTLELMKAHAAAASWLLVGEVFWATTPPPAVVDRFGPPETFADLAGTLDRFERAGLELVELMAASEQEWDDYATSQWLNVERWLREHPAASDAADVRAARDRSRREYLAEDRGVVGWALFVLRRR
jgi:SAM-dependent methyltransferase